MSPDGAIQAEHLWKRFRADRRKALLIEEMKRLRARLAGDVAAGWRWALRDVSLEVRPGESLALVGANGSGKSTLLKILTGVMYPYAGRLTVGGKVGALIEVSAGLHPDLTGRENAFLYGSLLGRSRKDVTARLDDIVAFAELDMAIDRQVKFFSSGMKMRLGFAVAALLDPDILLVDEVLAVGDASFQQKCLQRMQAVLNEGTTLVFVSHDLAAVEATCTRGIWLDDGMVATTGPIGDVLTAYRRSVEEAAEAAPRGTGPVRLLKLGVEGPAGGIARTQEPLDLTIVLDNDEAETARLYLGVSEGTASPIFSVRRDLRLVEGEAEIHCRIPRLPLPGGRYYVWVAVFAGRSRELLGWHPACHFDVFGPELDPAPRAVIRLSPVHVDSEWDFGAP